MSDTETRYSALERELLAVVCAVDYYRPYLFGRHFTLRTDHKPLLWTDGLKETSARVGRWKERLRAYSFSIVHHNGSRNVVADWLSRALYVNPLREAGLLGTQDTRDSAGVPEIAVDGDGDLVAVRPMQLRESDSPVNRYTRQIIWKTRMDGVSKSDYGRYGRHRIVTVWTRPSVTPDETAGILDSITRRGKTYNLYVGNNIVLDRIRHMWETGRIGP